ncbi:MAG: Prolipoprotein diacylglyceryl transferase [Myxococcales bacterium]|nr:Prolipoprotein diacylglyceryl transferase [Myxococcales bacterium]
MHPTLVRVSFLGVEHTIYAYGALVVAGMAIGILVGVARAGRFGIARFDELAVGLLGVAGGLVGGVVSYWIVHARDLFRDPSLLKTPGLVFYGGLIGGAVAAWSYCRAWKIPIARAADAGAPGLALGHAVGRIGCLMAGCCYGRPVVASFPLAVTLAGAPRHPTQLYEAAGLCVLAATTALLPARVTRRAGAAFLVYLGGYAILRLVVEHWRGDDVERGVVASLLSTSQLIALAMLLLTAALWYRTTRKGAT